MLDSADSYTVEDTLRTMPRWVIDESFINNNMVWEKECPQTFEMPLALAASCSTLDPQSMVKTNRPPSSQRHTQDDTMISKAKQYSKAYSSGGKAYSETGRKQNTTAKTEAGSQCWRKKRNGETWLILSVVEQTSWERRWKSGVLKMSVAITSIYSIANMFLELFVLSCLLTKEAE